MLGRVCIEVVRPVTKRLQKDTGRREERLPAPIAVEYLACRFKCLYFPCAQRNYIYFGLVTRCSCLYVYRVCAHNALTCTRTERADDAKHCVQRFFFLMDQGNMEFSYAVSGGFLTWGVHAWQGAPSQSFGQGVPRWACQPSFQYPVVLPPSSVEYLPSSVSPEWQGTCFLEMASAENPFVPGITLCIALARAAGTAPEGEWRKLRSHQHKLEGLLLEILERLPQTVEGFRAGMVGCSAVFEPGVGKFERDPLGPVSMIMQDRGLIEFFCAQPFIANFLSGRFTHSLPNLLDTRGVVHGKLDRLVSSGGARSQEYDSLGERETMSEDEKRMDASFGVIGLVDKLGEMKSI